MVKPHTIAFFREVINVALFSVFFGLLWHDGRICDYEINKKIKKRLKNYSLSEASERNSDQSQDNSRDSN